MLLSIIISNKWSAFSPGDDRKDRSGREKYKCRRGGRKEERGKKPLNDTKLMSPSAE